MDYSEYFDKLGQIHVASTDDSSKLDDFIYGLDEYKQTIRLFFSKNGDADSIKKLYKIIDSDQELKFKPIQVIDIDKARDMFINNFYKGMISYIEDKVISSSYNNDTIRKIQESLQSIDTFMDSIFGGELNKIITVNYSEALNLLEDLINFMNDIDLIENKSKSLQRVLISKKDEPCISQCIQLYTKAVSSFCLMYISEIMKIYNKILEQTNSPVITEPILKKRAFKLFI